MFRKSTYNEKLLLFGMLLLLAIMIGLFVFTERVIEERKRDGALVQTITPSADNGAATGHASSCAGCAHCSAEF